VQINSIYFKLTAPLAMPSPMFKGRNEIVWPLLVLPSLQRLSSIEVFVRATNFMEITEFDIERDDENTRAPKSPFSVAITLCVGPEILKNGVPIPAISTSG
jgi:hypothetical protein